MKTVLLSLVVIPLIAGGGVAADRCSTPACCESPGCCDQCGCQKICQVVCEMKEVKRHVWVVECEPFCPPLPRFPRPCRPCCDDCGTESCQSKVACCDAGCGKCCDPCEPLRNRCLVPPKCGPVRSRKKLVKKEVICEVPVYKCVVVCGGGCQADCRELGSAEQEAALQPPAPAGATTDLAPLPPVIGTSYLKHLKIRP